MTGRGSHTWCERCHKVWVDKRARFRMCPPCKRIAAEELRMSRRKIKARRAVRKSTAQGVAPMPEPSETPVPQNGHVRDRLTELSDDLKIQIARHYADYRIPVEKIVRHYAIANGDVTRIADEAGVERRDRRNTGRRLPEGYFTEQGEWHVVEAPLPEPQVKALEQMLKLPTLPEPPVEHRVDAALDEAWFEASVEGLVRISGTDMLQALTKLKAMYPNLKIAQIREL